LQNVRFLLYTALLLSTAYFSNAYAQLDMTPQKQTEMLQKLSPEQHSAAETEINKTGGVLTPETIKALREKPEFKDLSPENIIKGKELLEKKEIEKQEPEAGEETIKAEKVETAGEIKSLFDRYRTVGPYQSISTLLRPFGYDFFSKADGRALILRKDMPVSPDYIMGPGDEVKIMFWGRVNAQYDLVVDKDGNIIVPQIGPLQVHGMRFDEMKNFLYDQANQIVGAKINVTLGALKSIQVFVLGDVKNPGSYALDSFSTITGALLAAGGPTNIGSLRNIRLKRNGKPDVIMDFYHFLLKGEKSQDKILQSGDVVFIPTSGPLVGIAGNVKRPAIYELKEGKDLLSLFDMAGGVIPIAYTQQIQVERIQKNERQIVIDIDDKHLDKSKDFMLQDGDLVKVFSIVDKDVNVVFLNGNVKRPGKYEYKPDMKVNDIIKDTDDLLQETHFEYALIKRLRPPDMKAELVPFNLGSLLFENADDHNVRLEPQDSVYIFSRWFFKDKPKITIAGEVRKPGTFDLIENYRVRDAILEAGDLTKDAYLKKGEIIRVDEKRQYRTIYFNPESAITNDPVENIILQNEDKIIIHSVWEEKWEETVSITGEVKKPDEFVLTEAMHISDLVFKAGGLTRDSYLEDAELYRTDWKTKKVVLQRFNLKRALEGDLEHNITLKDLDKVVVHSVWEDIYKKTVSIEGEIAKPGTYQYTENMTIKDLIFASRNILESAYLDEAEVSSLTIEQGRTVKSDYRTINLGLALKDDPAHNIALQPYDRVFVKRIPEWQERIFTNVTGEVNFPGKYIIKKGERLSSVLERAGGYTDKAYLRGAFFTRDRVRQLQQKNNQEMIERLERELLSGGIVAVSTSLSKEEVEAKKVEIEQKQQFIESLKKVSATGRISIRLVHLRLLKGSEYDLLLENDDSLYIPTKPGEVNVAGSVMSDGSFIYSDRLDYMDYIEMAGGYSTYSDKKNVYVLKIDGSAHKLYRGSLNWSDSMSRWEIAGYEEDIREIEPGDTIVVPEKLERIAWMRNVKDITQILYQIAVTAGVLIVAF